MDDEILVHITAPTTREDDEFYRSLAEQYHTFEPATENEKNGGKVDSSSGPSSSRNLARNTPSALNDFAVSKESYGSFPSDVLAEEISSPVQVSGDEEDEMFDLPENTPVSSNRFVQLERMQRSWMRKQLARANNLTLSKSSPYGSTPIKKPVLPPDDDFIEDTQTAYLALDSEFMDNFSTAEEDPADEDVPIYIPSNNILERPTSAPEDLWEDDFDSNLEQAPQSTQEPPSSAQEPWGARTPRSTQDSRKTEELWSAPELFCLPSRDIEEPRSARELQSTQSARSPLKDSVDTVKKLVNMDASQDHDLDTSPAPKAKGQRAGQHPPDASSPTHAFTQLAPEPALDQILVTSQTSPEETESVDFRTLRSEVWGPPPRTSIDRPSDPKAYFRPTPLLQQVKEQYSDLYKPSRILGNWADDDRGDWRIDCSSWPPKVKLECWNSLADHVLSGRLSRHVFLYKDPRDEVLDWFQVHCWGSMVEEVWLLIYLCSQGKVLRSGAKWRQLPTEVFIEMP